MNLEERIAQISSRQDFVEFVTALRVKLNEDPTWWENRSLGDYLEAASAWTTDMDGYYANRGEAIPTEPSWRMFADILMSATMYE